MSKSLGVLVAASLVASLCCSGSAPKTPTASACDGPVVNLNPGEKTCADVQTALTSPQPGTTFVFGSGTFSCDNTLNIAGTNLTLRGAGAGSTIFDFSSQTAGADGMVSANGTDGLVLAGFTVQNSKQNGIKIIGSNAVTFEALSVTWTAADETTHGPYGIYPVGDSNVLIENCSVTGGSDSGIYVGQSNHAIVRNNQVSGNVAGIEIENTSNADVYGNVATDNAAGILVFDLPGLQKLGCDHIRVFNNQMVGNNHANFAVVGDIVGIVPSGTGFFAMASSQVEVFDNVLAANQAIGIGVISYLITGIAISDPNYYPFPDQVFTHDNVDFGQGTSSNGTGPDPTQVFGGLLATAAPAFPNGILPPLMIDGIVDPGVAADAGATMNPMQLCFSDNDLDLPQDAGYPGFADLHFDQFDPSAGPYGNLAMILTQDLPDFTCTLTALPAVALQMDAGC